MEECIFCKIARGAIPVETVLADDSFVAFPDINPKAPVHVLVVPKRHTVSLDTIDEWQAREGHELLSFVARVARRVGIAESGYRVIFNTGRDAGQEVGHLHAHILGGENLGDLR